MNASIAEIDVNTKRIADFLKQLLKKQLSFHVTFIFFARAKQIKPKVIGYKDVEKNAYLVWV